METKISDFMGQTMQKIKEMVDANTVIGTPIQADGVTIIPVSRISVGFASGGSEFATKHQKPEGENAFGGGGGASVKVTPVSFLILKGDMVKLLPVDPPASNTADRVVELVPELVDRVTTFIDQQKEKKAAEQETF
ncbi:GerW family sporulation protein [Pseudoflavonifractor gallinarum]|uniref:GerW family sporulation protein n=1 Tax=Pseudoflavonifractor hominis TaxID=2763059 RepID=A0ABR7HU37_9FIRM|nr:MULTISPECIES: GerW family sporulation protein [Eubacteriales]MBC5731033.1 GerW family sporulation protein [Pseudoflavonifractor hominis]MBS5136714.1 GerW family sporulation protein [Oscillospiraceae bacterium]MBT9684855.1 sporulation protein YtfJ [Pseudoflavonifractor sp. MCC625]